MKSIQELFPRASASTVALNPHLCDSATVNPSTKQNAVQPIVATRRGKMTRPEREMSMILETLRRNNEIESWKFEGVTLKLADGCRFTPDFFVVLGRRVRFVETKGPFIREDSMIKFKIAREQNQWAEWQLHQLNKNGWTQLF